MLQDKVQFQALLGIERIQAGDFVCFIAVIHFHIKTMEFVQQDGVFLFFSPQKERAIPKGVGLFLLRKADIFVEGHETKIRKAFVLFNG